jgi:hypothetical protein
MMNKYSKLTQTITYMALMAGLTVIFSLLALFVPLSAIFLVIALPLTSTLVTLQCDIKYYPIYATATLALTLIISMASIENVIFYILPSLISGFVFGFLIKKNVFALNVIIISSFVQLGLLYFSLWLIKIIFQFDFTDFIYQLLNVNVNPEAIVITPVLFFALSIMQATLTFLIIGFEINKLNYSITVKNRYPRLSGWTTIGIGLLIVPLGLWLPSLSFILLGPLFMYAGYHLYCIYRLNRYYFLILCGEWVILAFFLFAIFFPLLTPPLTLLLSSIFPLGISLIFIISFYLPTNDINHKIKG